ncbi:DUF6194 family protein [Micromonospora sp. HM5-17]|uniref:DUF6194 family protein n=1 Tax=Micromonospora sp. HM5-17 TaxID=2487710 RepID=UPI000F486BB5|nr:DUF6194 family protein [Micromonospora sp. HM5-17]ROT34223.1 hypothetical protein EF879_05165 [Micromonospora sp. HM5-17]
MNADEMTRYIRDTFEGVRVLEAFDDLFFLYDPHHDLPPERQMPFATIVTGDRYDSVSDLARPNTYRLNLGLTKATYLSRFGAPPTRRDGRGVWEAGADYAALDVLMPHPEYAPQYWVCVVNPGAASLPEVRDLLREAHTFAARKYANHRARQGQRERA